MMHYLIILLDDTSVSYCHYENTKTKRGLIALDNLKAGIMFAMKQNLMIQFVYPDYTLPQEYLDATETIDSHKIIPQNPYMEDADIIVLKDYSNVGRNKDILLYKGKILIVHMTKADFFANNGKIVSLLKTAKRLNIVLSDINTFTEQDFLLYKKRLEKLKDELKDICCQGNFPQFNLLTDRILLDKMNNCNAGIENITLAPNGKFYICPAFYIDDENDDVGNLVTGLDIKNQQLYQLQNAPICRICDAYQCKRCVWLNRKTTREVNTPSHEQCVTAHLERNASWSLLRDLQSFGGLTDKSIEAIDYLDPFEIKEIF
jgi:CXXX repeat peptide maturase